MARHPRTLTSRSIATRCFIVLFAAVAALLLGGAPATAQPQTSTPPETAADLTAEQKSWRDSENVIWCADHSDFPGCDDPSMGFKYLDDNTAFTVLRNRGNADGAVSTEVDVAGAPSRMIEEAADSAFGNSAEWIGKFAGEFLVDSMVWWIKTDSIDISYANVLAGKTPVQKIVGLIMMTGILTSAIAMMISRRMQPAAEILMGGVKYILISSLAMVVLRGAIHAGDDFAQQIVEDGANEFGQRIQAMLGTATLRNPAGVMFLGLLTAILSFIQWVMGFIRQAGIVVLYSLILFAAAGQLTSWGKQWFPRIAGACIALVLFKPIAAMIYSIGFKLIGTEQSMSTLVTGMMVITLAVIALPAMMKFFSFVGLQVGGGPGPGAVLAGVIAGGAGGAKLAGDLFGGGGSGGGDEHANFMAATGPNGSAESDPSPGNTGGQGELTTGGSQSALSSGDGPDTPAGGGPGETDVPELGPGSAAENPDSSGTATPTDAGSAGPDLGGAGGAGEGAAAGGAAGGAAAGGAAAATGGASLAAAAAMKAIEGTADAADGVASQMSQNTGPDT